MIRRLVQTVLDRIEKRARRQRIEHLASKFAVAPHEIEHLLGMAKGNENVVAHGLVAAAMLGVRNETGVGRVLAAIPATLDEQIARHRAAVTRHLLEELRASQAVWLARERGDGVELAEQRLQDATDRRLRCEAALRMQLAAKERKTERAERETTSTGDRAGTRGPQNTGPRETRQEEFS